MSSLLGNRISVGGTNSFIKFEDLQIAGAASPAKMPAIIDRRLIPGVEEMIFMVF